MAPFCLHINIKQESRWASTTSETFDEITANNLFRHPAGKARRLDCDAKCTDIWFMRGKDRLLTTSGPGSMSLVDSDIEVFINCASGKGKSKVTDIEA